MAEDHFEWFSPCRQFFRWLRTILSDFPFAGSCWGAKPEDADGICHQRWNVSKIIILITMNHHHYNHHESSQISPWQVLWTSWVRLRRGLGGLRTQARRTKALSGGRRHYHQYLYHTHHCNQHSREANVNCWAVSWRLTLCLRRWFRPSTNYHHLSSPSQPIICHNQNYLASPSQLITYQCHHDHCYQIICRPPASWSATRRM